MNTDASPWAKGGGSGGGGGGGSGGGESSGGKGPLIPSRAIHSERDLQAFRASRTYAELVRFVRLLSDAVVGQPVPHPPSRGDAPPMTTATTTTTAVTAAAAATTRTRTTTIGSGSLTSSSPSSRWSASVDAMVKLLDSLEEWVEDFPPLSQPMRFGNRAFRDWHARLVDQAPALLTEVLQTAAKNPPPAPPAPPAPPPPPAAAAASDAPSSSSSAPAAPGKEGEASAASATSGSNSAAGVVDARELAPYLCGSFGDPTRIDYGTGHETAFASLLYCLSRASVFGPADAPGLVLAVFARYVRLMRRLQGTYFLEPAGSHGVWGLDDYHCLPFLWGAAQLMEARRGPV